MGCNTTHRCSSDYGVSGRNLGYFKHYLLFYSTIPEINYSKDYEEKNHHLSYSTHPACHDACMGTDVNH